MIYYKGADPGNVERYDQPTVSASVPGSWKPVEELGARGEAGGGSNAALVPAAAVRSAARRYRHLSCLSAAVAASTPWKARGYFSGHGVLLRDPTSPLPHWHAESRRERLAGALRRLQHGP